MRKRRQSSLLRYRGAFWRMLGYQAVSKGLLGFGMWVARQLSGALLWVVGRSNYSHGDLPYMMRAWPGWVLLIAGTLALVGYTAFDLSVSLQFSRRALRGEALDFREIMASAWRALRRLVSPLGALVALYVTFILPLAGAAVGISLTNSFSIPDYIVSWIVRQRPQRILYFTALAALAALGVVYLFALHGLLLDDLPAGAALRNARRLTFRRGGRRLGRAAAFLAASLLGLAAMIALCTVLPLTLVARLRAGLKLSLAAARFWYVFIVLLGGGACLAAALLFLPAQALFLTALYDREAHPEIPFARPEPARVHPLALLGAAALAAVLALMLSANFDFFFPRNLTTQIIAHRGGGMLSTENTVEGLEAAIEAGAYASETDVRRTADGHYILNHDETFARVAGDRRRPSEMTLAQIKRLRVDGTAEVATMEEILDAAKGRIRLYIELKGRTADARMIDELYDMIVARDMLDQCVFISLNYQPIVLTEAMHPDMETVFLCYYAFGNFEDLVCDGLGLEAACATDANIARIHDAGLRVDVWTCNTTSSITQFLLSDADGVITDEVALAETLSDIFPQHRDLTRILNAFLPEF